LSAICCCVFEYVEATSTVVIQSGGVIYDSVSATLLATKVPNQFCPVFLKVAAQTREITLETFSAENNGQCCNTPRL
jgi:hypothetical protein